MVVAETKNMFFILIFFEKKIFHWYFAAVLSESFMSAMVYMLPHFLAFFRGTHSLSNPLSLSHDKFSSFYSTYVRCYASMCVSDFVEGCFRVVSSNEKKNFSIYVTELSDEIAHINCLSLSFRLFILLSKVYWGNSGSYHWERLELFSNL